MILIATVASLLPDSNPPADAFTIAAGQAPIPIAMGRRAAKDSIGLPKNREVACWSWRKRPQKPQEITMQRLTEIVQAIQHALHVTKPLLFELVLFTWAAVEMGRFIWTVALGHGE